MTTFCSPDDRSPHQGGEDVRGEVGAGVAALDEAGPIVADDDLLALAVHSEDGGVSEERLGSPQNCFLLLHLCDNSDKDTLQIVYKVAICPRGNLPYIHITSILLPYSQSTQTTW